MSRFSVLDGRYPRRLHGRPGFAHEPAGTHRPVSNGPHGVAPKFGGVLAPLHWLNAKAVRWHLGNDTQRRRSA